MAWGEIISDIALFLSAPEMEKLQMFGMEEKLCKRKGASYMISLLSDYDHHT
jgi:hypothetical protein